MSSQCNVLSFLVSILTLLAHEGYSLGAPGPSYISKIIAWHFLVWKTQPSIIDQPSQVCSEDRSSNICDLSSQSLNPTQTTRPSWSADTRITWPKPSGMFSDGGRKCSKAQTVLKLWHECDTHRFSYSRDRSKSHGHACLQ